MAPFSRSHKRYYKMFLIFSYKDYEIYLLLKNNNSSYNMWRSSRIKVLAIWVSKLLWKFEVLDNSQPFILSTNIKHAHIKHFRYKSKNKQSSLTFPISQENILYMKKSSYPQSQSLTLSSVYQLIITNKKSLRYPEKTFDSSGIFLSN